MRAGASVKIERGKQCDGSGTKTTLKGLRLAHAGNSTQPVPVFFFCPVDGPHAPPLYLQRREAAPAPPGGTGAYHTRVPKFHAPAVFVIA